MKLNIKENKLVLLDRDGVLNVDFVDYVKKPEELEIFPQALRALKKLEENQIKVGICTNQSGIARGIYSEEDLFLIHKKLQDEVFKAGGGKLNIIYCPNSDNNDFMRKPNAGMLYAQRDFFGLNNLSSVPFVGDAFRDVLAAKNAGAVPVLLKTGQGEETIKNYADKLEGVLIFKDLEEAVNLWLA